MCTCQLILRTEGLCVPLLRSTGWSVPFFRGDLTGVEWVGVVGSKARSPPPPPNPLFYFKNAYNPAVRAGCGLWGCTIEEPGLQPAPLPCHCNRQAVGSGVGGLGLLSAEISPPLELSPGHAYP